MPVVPRWAGCNLAASRGEGHDVAVFKDRPTGEISGGLALLLDRLWGQEVTHKLILAELFRHADLGTRLGLWTGDDPPSVMVEPGRGIFDLALVRNTDTVAFIELKFGAESGQNQRERQRAWAEARNAHRWYILLGTSYFEIPREAGVRYIGVPELVTALAATTFAGELGELAHAYLERLGLDARAWNGEHDPATAGSVETLRLYQEIADAWPVKVHPYRVINRSGPDWILNVGAWKAVDLAGWQAARLYWEIAGGHLRFKVEWNGDPRDRLTARAAYQRALELAAREVSVDLERTVARPGRSMAAGQLPVAVRERVLVAGHVAPDLARRLYDDATALFDAALRLLEPLTEPR